MPLQALDYFLRDKAEFNSHGKIVRRQWTINECSTSPIIINKVEKLYSAINRIKLKAQFPKSTNWGLWEGKICINLTAMVLFLP